MKMIENCVPGPNDVCEIDGENINEVCILGRVTDIAQENMRHMVGLEDSTGQTVVTFYNKGDQNVPQALANFEFREGEGQWVRVYGFIRVFNDQKSIVGINLQQITKMDEITNHFLKVFVSHNVRHKGVLDNKDLQTQKPNSVKN
jgi:RNase P/RNase MRP subunit p29